MAKKLQLHGSFPSKAGDSAYQVAQKNGFKGTEKEWLDSLVGERGVSGANGATFTPSVSEDGTVTWTNNKGLSNPTPVLIKNSGIHIGSDEPTNPNANIWIDPDEELYHDDSECIPAPATAAVGQTIVVKAVDENGKPTEWEAADFPSGGGDLELIYNTKTTEALTQLKVTKDNNGNSFELTKLLVIIKLPFRNTARETAYRISCGDESTAWHYLNVPATSNGWSFYVEQDATMHWGEYTSYKDGTYNSRAVADASINYNPSRRCTFFTFYSLNEPDFEIYIFGKRA